PRLEFSAEALHELRQDRLAPSRLRSPRACPRPLGRPGRERARAAFCDRLPGLALRRRAKQDRRNSTEARARTARPLPTKFRPLIGPDLGQARPARTALANRGAASRAYGALGVARRGTFGVLHGALRARTDVPLPVLRGLPPLPLRKRLAWLPRVLRGPFPE